MRENRQVRVFAAATSLVLALLLFLLATPFVLRAADRAEAARLKNAARKARAVLAVKKRGALRLRHFPSAKSSEWLSRYIGARVVVRAVNARAVASTRKAQSRPLPEDFQDALARFKGDEIVIATLSSYRVAAYLPLRSLRQSAKAPPAFVLRVDAARDEYLAAQKKLLFLGAALLFLAAPLTVATTHLLQRGIAARENQPQRSALPPPPGEEARLLYNQTHFWPRVLAKIKATLRGGSR